MINLVSGPLGIYNGGEPSLPVDKLTIEEGSLLYTIIDPPGFRVTSPSNSIDSTGLTLTSVAPIEGLYVTVCPHTPPSARRLRAAVINTLSKYCFILLDL